MQFVAPSIFRSEHETIGPRFTREIDQTLEKAEFIAKEIIGGEFSGYDHQESFGHVRVIHHYHDPLWYPMWGYSPSLRDCRPARRDEEKADRVALGIAFAAISLGTAFFMGRDWRISSEAEEELNRCDDEINRFCRYKEVQEAHPLIGQIRKVQDLEQRIFKRIDADARAGLWIKGALFTSSATGFVGCVAGGSLLSPLLTTGLLGTVGFGSLMLLRSGLNSNPSRNKQDAREILSEIRDLRR